MTNVKTLRKVVNTSLVVLSSASTLIPLVEEPVTVEATNTFSAKEFLEMVSPHAQKVARNNDLYASVMIAQAALESGWGNSSLAQAPNYNLFGIKGAYEGQSVNLSTLEDDGSGNYYGIQANFRKYPNYQASFQDNADLLTGNHDPNNWRYNFYLGVRKSQTSSYQKATAHLTGTYATDTRYGQKLNRLITMHDLTRFDVSENVAILRSGPTSKTQEPVTQQEAVTKESSLNETSSSSTYSVKSGDTLYRIAKNHHMTVSQLKEMNGLTSNLIRPNQALQVVTYMAKEQEKKNIQETSEEVPKLASNAQTATAENTYATKSGDTLYRIAHSHGMSVAELKRLNGLTSDLIYPNQTLKLKQTSEPVKDTPAVTTKVTSAPSYAVKSGDTLYRIAKNHHMTVSQLKEMNGLTSNLIRPNQALQVVTYMAKEQEKKNIQETSEEVPKLASNAQTATAENTYATKSGDTLYRIAHSHGMSVAELKRLNGLTSDLIYPNQTLKLKQTSEPVKDTPAVTTKVTSAPSYAVKSGDTLYRIAKNHHMTVNELKELNGLSSYLIRPNQRLKVSGTALTPKTPARPSPTQASTGSYSVQSGDNLYRIARNHNMTVKQLQELNGLSSHLIKPNQKLKVTGSSEQGASQYRTLRPHLYTVKSGENLYRIARNHGMSVSQLKQMNELSSNTIRPEQSLQVSQPVLEVQTPDDETVGLAPQNQATPPTSYTVTKGDTLYSIAQKHQQDVHALVEANNGSTVIHPGTELNFESSN